MNSNYISAPIRVTQTEGNFVDLNKTFDLSGTTNDEMLRLYLDKAGLYDQFDSLSPEQRRAYIYDIIKSNKMPGYWMPSTMKTNSFAQKTPTEGLSRPLAYQNISYVIFRNETTSAYLHHHATTRASPSSGGLRYMDRKSALMALSLAQPIHVSSTPITVPKNKIISKYEISSPINFAHVSGDMTRDNTKITFMPKF